MKAPSEHSCGDVNNLIIGSVLGVYATSNGKHGEQAFETYISNWKYQGIKQIRSQSDVEAVDEESS